MPGMVFASVRFRKIRCVDFIDIQYKVITYPPTYLPTYTARIY